MSAELWLGVDPGDEPGVAVIVPTSGEVGTLQLPKGSGDDEDAVAAVLDRFVGATLVIERQYGATYERADGREVVDFAGLEVLMFRRFIWLVGARRRGMKVKQVFPAQWQAKFFKQTNKVTKAVKRRGKVIEKRDTKAMARAVVASTWREILSIGGLVPGARTAQELTEHELDALLIARWGQLYGGRGG